MTKREYDISDVRLVKDTKAKTGQSIRAIAKNLGYPKSVVGRWVKDPIEYGRKYSFRDAKRKKPWLTEKERRKFMRMEHQILHEPIRKQSDFIITVDDDDTYTLGYM